MKMRTITSTWLNWIQWGMGVLSPMAAVFGVLLVIGPIVYAFAQTPTRQDYEIEALENQVRTLDQATHDIRDIDRRVTILETIQHTLGEENIWQRGSSIGTGLLILEAAVRIGNKKLKEKGEGG